MMKIEDLQLDPVTGGFKVKATLATGEVMEVEGFIPHEDHEDLSVVSKIINAPVEQVLADRGY